MHPKDLSIKDFTYQLPEEKIAFHPLEKRDESKLLLYRDHIISTDVYRNIADRIPEESLMIFNNTRVVEARLLFKKDTGGTIEIFCLEPHEMYTDITAAMNETQSVKWLCLIGGASKWKSGTVLTLAFTDGKNAHTLEAHYIEKRTDCFVIELRWHTDLSFAEVLHHAGHVPLPPYIKRADETSDKDRYQTVFARHDGSVAAPTAGLHFTAEVIKSLEEKGIQKGFVTLHVGAGTFKPVKAAIMQEHEMHLEFIEVEAPLIEQLIAHSDKPVVAVGTTSLRTLESLYWLGYKLIRQPEVFDAGLPGITQWEVYDANNAPPKKEALKALLQYMDKQKIHKLVAKTQIIIAPGYTFKIVQGLVTNFHQPASTLLLLVAAFIGDDWKNIYNYALNNDFRFLSYGDGCLLWTQTI
ncbi:MAG: S-adenosylmethionine:tRNA ribosyltransferase-isomerase [Niabella sp.]